MECSISNSLCMARKVLANYVGPFFRSMKISGRMFVLALSLLVAHSANSQGSVSFDAADSDIANGLYCFDLTGIGDGPMVGSPFALLGFSAIGNTQTLVSVSSPGGWHDFPYNDMDQALYRQRQLKFPIGDRSNSPLGMNSCVWWCRVSVTRSTT